MTSQPVHLIRRIGVGTGNVAIILDAGQQCRRRSCNIDLDIRARRVNEPMYPARRVGEGTRNLVGIVDPHGSRAGGEWEIQGLKYATAE